MNNRQILVLGAGRSSAYLIRYLAEHSDEMGCRIVVADMDIQNASSKIQNLPNCTGLALDPLAEPERLNQLVLESVAVVSLLPVSLHMQVAVCCLRNKVSFFTASYQSPELEAMESEIKAANVLFLNECGCDPGLDHMTALQIMDKLRAQGQEVIHYEGYTGGLVAPNSDTNPWHYKFSWNPRNVVLAGQSGPAVYWQNHQTVVVPYPRLFRSVQPINLEGHPDLVGYFNRNSLPYRELYGLEQASTVIRGTLRHKDFCLAWFPLAYWGLNTDLNLGRTPINYPSKAILEQSLAVELNYTPDEIQKVCDLWEFLGLFDKLNSENSVFNPAQLLEKRMIERMSLGEKDQDMVVMCHRIRSRSQEGRVIEHQSELILEGEGGEYSAMAKTVGWPLAMAIECHLKGQVAETGLQRPLSPVWYRPILHGLAEQGVTCRETHIKPD
ncbi:MAG: saccharopine dehydrogenase C-terminal domain-containing protein [Bacteroidia bacterium]